ncbi:hypothetical protein [Oceanobacillus sp. FSL W7-1281]|uniref:sunset domain-containing protein n=1 Tax=Oceanobacillus sp. FSL W7-1281 TaxID=2921698 RepID=UPI0030D9EB70
METFIVISIIFVLSGLAVYTLSHSTSNRKTMKKYLPLLALAMFFILLSGCGTDNNSADSDQEIENNEELTSEIATLEEANSSLQEEYDELQSQFNELEDENEKLEDYESIKEGNESLTEEIAALEEENEKFEDYESIKEKNESLSEEITTLQESNSELQQQLEESQEADRSGSSASSTSAEDSDDNDTTASSSQPDEGECNIKGSESGIYHLPGSTYYDRTTNVVSWLCSEEEAQEAGYRAPKN